MLNEDQKAHMRALAATPPTQLHWCGWYRNEQHLYPETHLHAHCGCPSEFTVRDKLNMRCEVCGNEPHLEGGGRLVHLAGCTPAYRRSFYEAFDLGEAGA